MASPRRPSRPICSSARLAEQASYGFHVHYRGSLREAILIRHRGVAYCYLNQCVHMPKALDCEHCHVFDETGEFLRCSMHGIVYEPDTGLCRSEICAGQSLTVLKIEERDGQIRLIEKRAELPE